MQTQSGMPIMERLKGTGRWQRECDLHPHAPAERAELFSSVESGAAELETLELLYALVRITKPERVLETGTGSGWTTVAIAGALLENGFGTLDTLEIDEGTAERARFLLGALAPEAGHLVHFHMASSLDFIAGCSGEPYGFALFDSLIAFRHVEFEAMLARGLLAPGALCAFHDTSRLRGQTMHDFNPEMIATLDQHTEGRQHLEFSLSRGLRLIRV